MRGKLGEGFWVLLSLLLACLLIETLLQITDRFVAVQSVRASFYENGAFWVGILRDWEPNYAAQPYLMFLTYGFFHAGLLHLAANMITLWSLGSSVISRVGAWRFLQLYFGAMIGGGAGQGILAVQNYPVVGASGALFGLVGSLLAWTYMDRYSKGQTFLPVLQAVALLVALNILLWWALDGRMAWQTHLGGFVSGWVMALLVTPRPYTV